VEAYGVELPIVAMPYTNDRMARFPAFQESIAKLTAWGVRMIFGDEVQLFPPGVGEGHRDEFPWHLAIEALARHPWPSASRHAEIQ
jgi:hypothetical protein